MLKKIFFELIINGLCVFAVSYLLPDLVKVEGGYSFYIIAAFLIGILNVAIKPLLKILSFPLIFITGGLFLMVINGIILWMFVYLLRVLDFEGISMEILGLKAYVLAAIILGLTNSFSHWLLKLRR